MGLAVIVVLMFGLQAVHGRYGCPVAHDFERVTVYKDKCYGFATAEKDKVHYRDAAAACKRLGGTLAMPKTSDVNTVLANRLVSGTDGRAWIGLNDAEDENVFRWEDGSRLAGFEAFPSGEGQDSRRHAGHGWEDCVTLDSQGTWHDYACVNVLFIFEHYNYICEFNMPPTTTTTTTTPTTTTTTASTITTPPPTTTTTTPTPIYPGHTATTT